MLFKTLDEMKEKISPKIKMYPKKVDVFTKMY
jgi:hypothetical protein